MTLQRWAVLALILMLFSAGPTVAVAARADAPAKLTGLAEAMDKRTKALDSLRELDEKGLRDRIAALKKQLADERTRLDRATKQLTGLRAERTAMAREYDEVATDMQSVEDAVRSNAAQFSALMEKSPAASLNPGSREPLEAITASAAFPRIEAITGFGGLMLHEIRSGATVDKADGSFLGPDGATRHGKLLRAGSLFLGAVDEDGNGHLLLPGSIPPAAAAFTPGRAAAAIRAWADASADVLPLDPSHGAAFSLLQSRRSVDDWIESGGILLWPILMVGLLALMAIAYKAVGLFNARPSPGDFSRRLRTAWDSGRWESVQTLLRALPRVPAARALLWIDPDSAPDLCEKQLKEGVLSELRRLESMLGFIAVMAAVAPLLGLLGTVTGMIDSFQAITVFGSSNPRIMAGGISEALVTTQAGLGVAIPVMLMHQLLKQRVQKLAGDMEQQSAAMQALIAAENEGQPEGGYHE